MPVEELSTMDTLQNGYIDDFYCNVDDSWMMNEADEWNIIQNNAQNLAEMIDRLEVNIKENFQHLIEKITGIEKDDVDKTENLLQSFKTRWEAKCKETENLRVSLKRATHESTRINDHYHEMEDLISKMRQQFGQAIDSSVTEIEELAICNSSLSETIQNLEAKIRRGDKAYKQNGRDNLASLKEIIKLADKEDLNLKTLQTRLKKEADKIDRMIKVEDLFTNDQSNVDSNLAEKSQKMVDGISKGLVETLKGEVKECRKIVDQQRRRIKDLEREKEEFLKNQLAAQNDGVYEMNKLLEYLRRSVAQKSVSGDNNTSELNAITRNITGMKRIVNCLNDGLDKSYKNVVSKNSDITELKDNIKDLTDQIKTFTIQTEDLTEKNDFLKLKVEQSENQYRLANDELHTIQRRLKTLDDERKALFDETVELKDGKFNIEGVCSNLSDENNMLGEKFKEIQMERDKVFTDLHEQIQRINHYSIENNELQQKCENLEHAIVKIRREYHDQTREINMITRENDEMKTSLQDSEQERLKIRRSMKSVETRNKDLEDQLFQITNETQKMKSELAKTLKSQHENKYAYSEMSEKIENIQQERITLENQFNITEIEKKELEESIKTMTSLLDHDKELSDKSNLLLTSYEKLLIKLLHQRKEMLAIHKLDKLKEFQNISLQVSSTQSIDYKDTVQIENCFKLTTDETESTFNALATDSNMLQNKEKAYKTFCTDLSSYLKENCDYDNDSCYSTENDLDSVSFLSGRDISDGKRGLDALKSFKKEDPDFLPKLMKKIQKCLERGVSTDSKQNSDSLVRKLNSAEKKLRQLKIKLRNRKSLEHNMKNKISHLKQEAKILKSFHRSVHSKSSPRSPHNQTPTEIELDREEIIKKLRNAEEELQHIRSLLNDCSDENRKQKMGEHLETVEVTMQNLQELLSTESNVQTISSLPDELNERFEVLSDQRQYMLDHLLFTNKRLEVLLNCLKGRQENLDGNNNLNERNTIQPVYTKRVLKRVRDSFKNDQAAMQRAVSILELTKAISVTDLTERSGNNFIDENDRDMIVLVKNLNDNMESVLREARSNITNGKVVSELANKMEGAKLADTPVAGNNEITNKHATFSSEKEFIPKSELLKKESELKMSLENAHKKVDTLSQYLEQREAEIKERDEIIAKLNKEYEDLKLKANDKTDEGISTRDRMIKEYVKEKNRLKKENDFLQMVVKEVRDELIHFQKTYKKEEETQQHMQEFINELQIRKTSLEQSLDKLGYELNIVKKDRDHLMQTMNEMSLRNMYPYYADSAMIPHDMYDYHSDSYHDDPNYYPECSMCSYQDYSVSTTFPLTEDEELDCTLDCTASCNGVESLPSDGEHADGVISSSESHTTTSSRVAKNIKTEEAAKHRPEKYLNKQETRTGKSLLSPKISRHRASTMPDNDPFDAFSIGSTNTGPVSIISSSSAKPARVQGRREQNMKQGKDSFKPSSSRRSSQDSISSFKKASEPQNRYSYPTFLDVENPSQLNQSPILDIDAAIGTASNAEQNYYENKKANKSPRNPQNLQLVTPFVSSSYDVNKKRKKKFLAFGKKEKI